MAAGSDDRNWSVGDLMGGLVHRLNYQVSELLRAPVTGQVGKHHTPEHTHVVRIALTGGPCAGKSSALKYVVKEATQRGFDVYIAPETATLIFNSGVMFDPEESFILALQQSIMTMQLEMERALTRIAATTGRPSILILDRGLLDGKGYIDQPGWNKVLSLVDQNDTRAVVTEEYLLNRYDGVIHMMTAAQGAEDFYKMGHTTDDDGRPVFRKETILEARELDVQMRGCWRNHHRHIVVDNSHKDFDGKLAFVTTQVLAIALEKHPQNRPPIQFKKQ